MHRHYYFNLTNDKICHIITHSSLDKGSNLVIIMTKGTSQQLLETGHKVTTMQSGYIKLTSPNRFYGYTESIGVCVAAARRVSLCSLFLCVINAKLTMLSAWLTPPPALNIK